MSIGGLTGYQSLQDLRGKLGHVGAPFGKIRDVALRFALTKVGLDPEEDVKLVLVQSARPDPVNIIAQMENGRSAVWPRLLRR